MNQESFSFVIYMIHACAAKWKTTPSKVYAKLRESKCLDQYLVPNYDILHTQGTNFIVQDIEEYLALRGVTI